MDVVDEHQQRLLGGEVRGQPVEAVQRRGRRPRSAPDAAARAGERRGAGEVLVARHRLEQLPDDGEREVALELGRRARSGPARRPASARAAPSSRVLPIPGGPSISSPAPPRTRRAEHPPHGGDLGVPFLERVTPANHKGVRPLRFGRSVRGWPRCRAGGCGGKLRGMTAIDPGAQIGHVHLKVADLDRAVSFYRDVLGFEVTGRIGDQLALPGRRRLSPPHRAEHVRELGRAPRPGSTTPRSATRPATALARALRRVLDAAAIRSATAPTMAPSSRST